MKSFWSDFLMAEDFFRQMVRENARSWKLIFHQVNIAVWFFCALLLLRCFMTWLCLQYFKGTWYTPEFNEFQIVRIIAYVSLAGCFVFVIQAVGAVGTLLKALRFKAEEYV